MSNIFETVRDNVELIRVVENAGIKVNRSHMCVCPFHPDKNPSMKINAKRFYCFGCQVKGDSVDFVSMYYGLGLYDAAKKICDDFRLSYDKNYDSSKPPPVRVPKPKTDEQKLNEIEKRSFNVLCDYRNMLITWKKEYEPKEKDEEYHPLFVEALQNLSKIEYLLDTLLFGEISDRVLLLSDYGKEVIELEGRLKSIKRKREKYTGLSI